MSLNVTLDAFPSGDTNSCSIIPGSAVVFLSCLYAVNTLLGLSLNILVLWAIWPEVRRSSGLPTYVISLLCAALLECLLLPVGVAYILDSLELGFWGCHILRLIPKIAQRIATVFLMCIFVLRYIAVTHPLRFREYCSGWMCASISMTLWLSVIAISVTEHTLTTDTYGICFPDFSTGLEEWALIDLILSIFFSHLPLIHLYVFGHLISCTLKNSSSIPREQHRRISRLLFLVVLIFGVQFCPMHVVLQYKSILILNGQSICQVKQTLILPYQLLFALNSVSVVIAPFFYVFSSSAVNKRLIPFFHQRPG